jgi:alkylhydroperoxidase family enzyme
MIAEHHVPDAVYNEAHQYFSEQELVNLSLAVVAINGWNRLAISFHSEVGAYRAGTVAAMMKKV